MKNKLFTFFWHGPFSQWHKSEFCETQWDRSELTFFCAEQFMMAKKAKLFHDYETFQKIMDSTSPKQVKDLGREVKNFSQVIWDRYKFSIVYQGNLLKFMQNDDLMKLLIDTEDTILVEASPYDKVWGIGLAEDNPDALDMNKWRGQNLLGKALTGVRDQLVCYDLYRECRPVSDN